MGNRCFNVVLFAIIAFLAAGARQSNPGRIVHPSPIFTVANAMRDRTHHARRPSYPSGAQVAQARTFSAQTALPRAECRADLEKGLCLLSLTQAVCEAMHGQSTPHSVEAFCSRPGGIDAATQMYCLAAMADPKIRAWGAQHGTWATSAPLAADCDPTSWQELTVQDLLAAKNKYIFSRTSLKSDFEFSLLLQCDPELARFRAEKSLPGGDPTGALFGTGPNAVTKDRHSGFCGPPKAVGQDCEFLEGLKPLWAKGTQYGLGYCEGLEATSLAAKYRCSGLRKQLIHVAKGKSSFNTVQFTSFEDIILAAGIRCT